MTMLTRSSLSLLLCLLPAALMAEEPREQSRVYQHGVVAADHPLASQVGVEILKQGGNAVDAAVATSFALSVLRPYSCGLGGGGFMMIWDAEKGEGIALDYRERAPAAATRKMFEDPDNPGTVKGNISEVGHLAVAVPGTVAGLVYAQQKYGKLDLKTVLAPAIRLAREGFPLNEDTRGTNQEVLADFASHPHYREQYSALYEQYLNHGKPWPKSAVVTSPQLRVLELIAEHGAAGFYEGEVADAIVAEMERGGGLITLDDLKQMKPVVREPLRGTFRGTQILTMPPPSSGGIAILEMMNLIAAIERKNPEWKLNTLGHNSGDYLHLLTECMKHAFADRAEFLGDQDFVEVPVSRLIDPHYAANLANHFEMSKTFPLEKYGHSLVPDDNGTSHLCVMDSAGNAVACTETINTYYGSYVVEPKFGIILNNEMDDFAAIPGRPNAFGLIQSEANAVAPGKKPLSSMSPTIIVKDGKAIFSAGASGGPRIISATFQVLLNMIVFNMTPEEAILQPRCHHQWFPNTLYLEPALTKKVKPELEKRGHKVSARGELAVTQAAMRTQEGLRAASDPRKNSTAAGW